MNKVGGPKKVLYIDCFSGISGNMLLGALIDLGVDPSAVESQVSKILSGPARLQINQVRRGFICAPHVELSMSGIGPTSYHEIYGLISESPLPPQIKEGALKVISLVESGERKAFGNAAQSFRFTHRHGGADLVLDAVGILAAISSLGVSEIVCSPVPLGTGVRQGPHGTVPIPNPAVLNILGETPTAKVSLNAELVTATGAALLRCLVSKFGPVPHLTLEKVGYGAGSQELPIPNVLRTLIGTVPNENPINLHMAQIKPEPDFEEDTVTIIETNIDDVNPEHYPNMAKRLYAAGALDVSLTPLTMKHGRPGTKVTVLVPPEHAANVTTALLAHSTTFGVRVHQETRRKLQRTTVAVETAFGVVRVKLGFASGALLQVSPEHKDCELLSLRSKVPIKTVYQLAIAGCRELIEAYALKCQT